MRLTSVGRTAFDLARRLDIFEAVVGFDAMLAKRLLTKEDLATSAKRRPGWLGTPQVRHVLMLCDPGPSRRRSRGFGSSSSRVGCRCP
jgi:hypothetical protein